MFSLCALCLTSTPDLSQSEQITVSFRFKGLDTALQNLNIISLSLSYIDSVLNTCYFINLLHLGFFCNSFHCWCIWRSHFSYFPLQPLFLLLLFRCAYSSPFFNVNPLPAFLFIHLILSSPPIRLKSLQLL